MTDSKRGSARSDLRPPGDENYRPWQRTFALWLDRKKEDILYLSDFRKLCQERIVNLALKIDQQMVEVGFLVRIMNLSVRPSECSIENEEERLSN